MKKGTDLKKLLLVSALVLAMLPLFAAEALAASEPVFPVACTDVTKITALTYGGDPAKYANGGEDYTNAHHGTDYRAVDFSGAGCVYGADVYAVQDGEVVQSRSSDGTLYIKHTVPLTLADGSRTYNTWFTVYAHLSTKNVKVGDKVKQKQVIGKVGNTGAKSAHLHFGVTTKLYTPSAGRYDGLNYYYSYKDAKNPAFLKTLCDATLSPKWLGGDYARVNYSAGRDLADRCALARITGDTSAAPPGDCPDHGRNVIAGLCQGCGAVIESKLGYTVTANVNKALLPKSGNITIRTTPYNSADAGSKFSNATTLSAASVSYFHIIQEGKNNVNHVWYKSDYYVCKDGAQVNKVCYIYNTNSTLTTKIPTNPTASAATTTALNLRSGGGTGNTSVLTLIPAGAVVTVDSAGTADSGWLKVSYNGTSGYSCSEYLNLQGSDKGTGLKISQSTLNYKAGSQPTVSGQVSSGKTVTFIKVTVDGKCFGYTNPKSTTVYLKNLSFLNKLSGVAAGSHTMTVTAMDAGGSVSIQSIALNVSATETLRPPTVTVQEDYGCKRMTVTNNAPGSTLYYYLSSGEPAVYTGPVTLTESNLFRAFSEKNGLYSEVVTCDVRLEPLNAPTISYEQRGSKGYVKLVNQNNVDTELFYSTDGGLSFSRANGTVTVTKDSTITAYCRRVGYITSERTSAAVKLKGATTPYIVITRSKVALGDPVSATWLGAEYADRFVVTLKNSDGEAVDTRTVSSETHGVSFTPKETGAYSISVRAENAFGSATATSKTAVQVMPDLQVSFVDYDGTVLSSQTVKYGGNAVKPGAVPSRRGYTFTGWSGGNFNAITADTTFSATYQINTYKVRFYDYDGKLVSTQTVEYGSAAAEPEHPACPERYQFTAWALTYAKEDDSLCDFRSVDSDLSFQAVKCWDDATLPVEVKITAAERYSSTGNYIISVSIENYDQEETTALLRVALKDGTGQMVKTQDLEFQRSPGETKTETLTLKCSELVSVAEAYVLGMERNDLTATALSAAAVSPIVEKTAGYGVWTDWSTDVPEEKTGRQIESKVEYRSRYKRTRTSSSSASIEGWTYNGTRIQYGSWTDAGWTSVQPTESNTLQITETRTVTDAAAYTLYKYYHWYGYSGSTIYQSYGNGVWKNYESTTSTTPFTPSNVYDGYQSYIGAVSGMHGSRWWLESTTYVPAVTHTEWFYQTRTANTVYSFFQWTEWTEWQSSKVNKLLYQNEHESRTVYRYRDMAKETIADGGITESTESPISGAIDTQDDLCGKLATVMVYSAKNTDPNESQMQFIGQTTIGEGNAYSFCVKPKADPTLDSGDYIVALGIQGCSGLINIGMIEAPKPTYTVTFFGEDGQTVSTQCVKEGENAVLPEAPEIAGMRFIMWDNPARNVHEDLSVSAVYEKLTYAVAFVDWMNEEITLQTACAGETVTLPGTPAAEGFTFDKWVIRTEAGTVDAADAVITGNTVIEAQWRAETYTVNFYIDRDDAQPFSTQTVAFGTAAVLPEAPTAQQLPEGVMFLGWSNDECWWNVTEDIDVTAITAYERTTMTPDAKEGFYIANLDGTVTLQAEENAAIYYTLDGSVPTTDSMLYSEPLKLTESAAVKAIAIAENKNPSEVLEVEFVYQEPELFVYDPVDWEEIGRGVLSVTPGDTVEVSVELPENPGLISYQFRIECDTGVFFVEYDEESGYGCTGGEASENGVLLSAPYADSGYQVLWYAAEGTNKAGRLFTLPLSVAEEAESGTYPVRVLYAPANTFTESGLTAAETAYRVSFSEQAIIWGDVNGDGRVTNADVIRLARSLVELEVLTEEQKAAADVSHDGFVTNADVIRLARFLVDLETSLS